MASLTINPEMIRGVVETQIQAAIVAQFEKTPQLIESVVSAALKAKVNKSGGISSYSYENTHDLVNVLCANAIQDCAKQAVHAWVEEKKPEITAAIKKHLNANKAKTVQAFVDAAERALSPNFYVSCTLKTEE